MLYKTDYSGERLPCHFAWKSNFKAIHQQHPHTCSALSRIKQQQTLPTMADALALSISQLKLAGHAVDTIDVHDLDESAGQDITSSEIGRYLSALLAFGLKCTIAMTDGFRSQIQLLSRHRPRDGRYHHPPYG